MSGPWFNRNVKCNRCGKMGHNARSCPGQSQPTNQPTGSATAPAPAATAVPITPAASTTPAAPTAPQRVSTGVSATPAPLVKSWANVASKSSSASLPIRTSQTPAPTSVPATATPPARVTQGPNAKAASFRPSVRAQAASNLRDNSFQVDLASIGVELSEEQKLLDPIKQKHEFGIRVGYGTRKEIPASEKQQERWVVTNYVEIPKRPKTIFVYKLKIVRQRVPAGRDVLVKDKTEKKAIFDQLKLQPGYTSLNTRRDYATDYDLIWAKEPLFKERGNTQATPPPPPSFQANDPHTNIPIVFQSVSISWERTIDASQSPLSMLRSPTASTDITDDGAILIRGINAFATQYARDNMATKRYASTAVNKFFLTQGEHEEYLQAPGRPLRETLRAFRGFSVSARPGVDDLYLNIHIGASPFLGNVSVAKLLEGFRYMENISPREAFNVLKRKEAVVVDTGLRVIITDVGNQAFRDRLQDLHKWSDFDEFLGRIGSTLDTLLVNVITAVQHNPVEAQNVKISGFHAFRGLLSSSQTTAMLTFACKLPIYNKKYLDTSGLEMLGVDGPPAQQRATNLGMSIGTNLLKVPARWLKAPRLHYSGIPKHSQEASWNLSKCRFLVPSQAFKKIMIMDLHLLHNWGYARRPDLGNVAPKLEQELRNLGLTEMRVIPYLQPAPDRAFPAEEKVLEYFQKLSDEPISNPVLVVLPEKSYDSYARVKRVADLMLGRHAVCVLSKGKFDQQYFANVAMKFNLKGAGTNHAVETDHLASILGHVSDPPAKSCQTIILGADVAHPTVSAKPGCPSIAAVVGSTDDKYLHYPGSMRLQINRQEFIAELADMVKERLIDWANKHDGKLPANVLFYRDGVSESQYKMVRESEIPQLKDAYALAHKHLGKGDSPPPFKLTFIVVGKRHNTRFFTDNSCAESSFRSPVSISDLANQASLEADEDQKFVATRNGRFTRVNHNLLPGFVVDRVITHPYSNDFFLQSHKPLQGTGRSAHYFVLTNQMCLNPDDLQRVTHALCYIYAGATKGVSYCAPAYYADRLCDRGRAWLRDHLFGRLSIPQGRGEDPDAFKARARDAVDQGDYWRPRPSNNEQKYGEARKNPWHPNLDDIMFYL